MDAHTALDQSALAILFAIPFDALDGRIARMTNTTSEFGKELDSLADVITFGVAPSLLAYVWGFHFLPDSVNQVLRLDIQHIGAFVCFLFLIGGASRLARFNISHNPVPRNPGRPGPEILRRHADPGGRRHPGYERALLHGVSNPGVVGVGDCGSPWWVPAVS